MKCGWKNVIIPFLGFLLFQQLTGCYYPGTPDATRLYAPYCIASQNVPFADNLHTHQWDRVSIKEKDDYGRTYYLYQTPSVMLGYEIEIHVICQSEGEDREYGYYEDICYIIREVDGTPFSKDEIAEFKIKNHWNKAIVPEKIMYTSYETHNLRIANEKELDLAISQLFKIYDGRWFNCNAMEVYGDKQMFFVVVEDRFYLIGYQKNSEHPIVICEEIPFSLSPQEDIRTIRDRFKE